MKTRTFTIVVAALLALILGVTFLGLHGRKSAKPPANLASTMSKGFDAGATIRMKDLVMVGDINKTKSGALTIAIKEPKHLKGMTFEYDGDDVSVSYKGIKIKLDENSKLVSSALSVIVNAIDKASSDSGVNVGIDGKALIVSGDCDSGKFDIKLDKKTGSMISLKLDELDFECNFDDFVFS